MEGGYSLSSPVPVPPKKVSSARTNNKNLIPVKKTDGKEKNTIIIKCNETHECGAGLSASSKEVHSNKVKILDLEGTLNPLQSHNENSTGTTTVNPEPIVMGRIGRGKNKKYGDDSVIKGVNKSQNIIHNPITNSVNSVSSSDYKTATPSTNIVKPCNIDNADSTTNVLSYSTATTNILSYAAATAKSPIQNRTPTPDSSLSNIDSKNCNLDIQGKEYFKICSDHVNNTADDRFDIPDYGKSDGSKFKYSEDPDIMFCQRPGDGGLVKG